MSPSPLRHSQGCSSKYSLDLSTGAFDQIGDEDTGELSISWYFSS